jgi:hypothetical protein
VLLTDHVEGERPILVYGVDDLTATLADLTACGWERESTTEPDTAVGCDGASDGVPSHADAESSITPARITAVRAQRIASSFAGVAMLRLEQPSRGGTSIPVRPPSGGHGYAGT